MYSEYIMDIKELFPHPVAEVFLDVDLTSIVSDAMEIATEDVKAGWDCETISTFNEDKLNFEFARRQYDFLNQVEVAGKEFLMKVGWMNEEPHHLVHWWVNAYRNQHWQEWHHHGKHDVCGIFYATADAVPTLFLNPNEYTFHAKTGMSETWGVSNPFKQKHHVVFPEPGKLVLFPGYMYHSVPYKNSNVNINYTQNRVTFAFNFGQPRVRPLDEFANDEGQMSFF